MPRRLAAATTLMLGLYGLLLAVPLSMADAPALASQGDQASLVVEAGPGCPGGDVDTAEGPGQEPGGTAGPPSSTDCPPTSTTATSTTAVVTVTSEPATSSASTTTTTVAQQASTTSAHPTTTGMPHATTAAGGGADQNVGGQGGAAGGGRSGRDGAVPSPASSPPRLNGPDWLPFSGSGLAPILLAGLILLAAASSGLRGRRGTGPDDPGPWGRW